MEIIAIIVVTLMISSIAYAMKRASQSQFGQDVLEGVSYQRKQAIVDGRASWSQGSVQLELKVGREHSALVSAPHLLMLARASMPGAQALNMQVESLAKKSFGVGDQQVSGTQLLLSDLATLSLGSVYAELLLEHVITILGVEPGELCADREGAPAVTGRLEVREGVWSLVCWSHERANPDVERTILFMKRRIKALAGCCEGVGAEPALVLARRFFEADASLGFAPRVFALRVLREHAPASALYQELLERAWEQGSAGVIYFGMSAQEVAGLARELSLPRLFELLEAFHTLSLAHDPHGGASREHTLIFDQLVRLVIPQLDDGAQLPEVARSAPRSLDAILRGWDTLRFEQEQLATLCELLPGLPEDVQKRALAMLLERFTLDWSALLCHRHMSAETAEDVFRLMRMVSSLEQHHPEAFAREELTRVLLGWFLIGRKAELRRLQEVLVSCAPSALIALTGKMIRETPGGAGRDALARLLEALQTHHGVAHRAGALSLIEAAGGELTMAHEKGAVTLSSEEE